MRIALDPGARDSPAVLQRLAEDGSPLAEPQRLAHLGAVAEMGREHRPRWVFARSRTHRRLLTAGVEVARAHDVELVEGILVGAAGQFGQPHGLAAAAARLAGRTPDPDPPAATDGPPALSDTGPSEELADVVAVHAAQQRALAADPGLRLLAAAESAGGLLAEEMAQSCGSCCASPVPRRSWCSSSTTRCSCTARPTPPRRWRRPSAMPRPRRGGSCRRHAGQVPDAAADRRGLRRALNTCTAGKIEYRMSGGIVATRLDDTDWWSSC